MYAIWAKLLIKDGKHQDALTPSERARRRYHNMMKNRPPSRQQEGRGHQEATGKLPAVLARRVRQAMVMRGRRGGPTVQQPTMRIGAKHLRRRSWT